jgi:predicted nuclease of restriction endonuclease-like (RecB) superfamily
MLEGEGTNVQGGDMAAKKPVETKDRNYFEVFEDVAELLEASRAASARSINALMTATYWLVGQRIFEGEQQGKGRADYGAQLVRQLAGDLSARFGRGFGRANLFQMRAFFLAYREIVQTASGQSGSVKKVQTASGQWAQQEVQAASAQLLPDLARAFPLPWSHYVRLLAVKNPLARSFYEAEALRGGWTYRQLDRQIQSQFYERAALSRNKAPVLAKGSKLEEDLAPEDAIKNPFILEFLDLKDEYSESALEEALVKKLETFLLELGGAFTFVGRQRRLRVGDEWYRVDLVFFHRELRCLVIIDLKLGKFTHADAGQMHLYLNYAREHWMVKGENPPVGLILCAEKDHAVARYALEGLPNKVMAAEYRTALPDEETLVEQVRQAQVALTRRRAR